ncbi:hypothetical protein EZZ80_13460 [Pseudomonas putida]|nr:hypothetical protein FFH79_015785 [Pseudomonas sp. KBS0802]UZA74440.1 hypothetical protein EZZ80_13460 [Pseudomonas putida]
MIAPPAPFIRLEHDPGKMKVRRQTVEHPFGTLKIGMGSTHFRRLSALYRLAADLFGHWGIRRR